MYYIYISTEHRTYCSRLVKHHTFTKQLSPGPIVLNGQILFKMNIMGAKGLLLMGTGN